LRDTGPGASLASGQREHGATVSTVHAMLPRQAGAESGDANGSGLDQQIDGE
jgi:hypothetical protein